MELMIGGKLKQLRLDKKLSIAELSRLSDVSTGLISQIERDLVVPSVTSLWRLAKALDTNINYFFLRRTTRGAADYSQGFAPHHRHPP